MDNIAENTTTPDKNAKVVKVKKGESIGTVLSAEGFKLPENGDKAFGGWYTAAVDGTKVDMASGEEVKELFAGWVDTDKKVGVTTAEITGATDGVAKVGDTLTAKENQDATGQLSYQWLSCATEDGTYAPIEGATKSNYTVQEADAGKYIKVTISGDNNSSVTSEAVKVSEMEKTDVVVTKVTATIAASGAAVEPVSGNVENNTVTLTVAASGSSITVTGISVETQDGVKVTTTLDKEDVKVDADGQQTIKVTCKPEDADKYNEVTVEVIIVNKTEN